MTTSLSLPASPCVCVCVCVCVRVCVCDSMIRISSQSGRQSCHELSTKSNRQMVEHEGCRQRLLQIYTSPSCSRSRKKCDYVGRLVHHAAPADLYIANGQPSQESWVHISVRLHCQSYCCSRYPRPSPTRPPLTCSESQTRLRAGLLTQTWRNRLNTFAATHERFVGP